MLRSLVAFLHLSVCFKMDVDPTSEEETYGVGYSEVDAGQIPDEADAKLISTIFGRDIRRQNVPQVPTGPAIDDESYPMNHGRRGLAVIFNHWNYRDKTIKGRTGADVDQRALATQLQRLEFEIQLCENYTLDNIKQKLKQVREMDHADADCLVVVVMTHGKSSELHAFDVIYSEDMLWDSFTGSKCPTLRGKPKLFFIQACRGQEIDDGVKLNVARTQTDGKPPQKTITYTIPNTADFLIAHATFDGYYAWRSPESGSWFIQALCTELNQHGTEYDILRLMTAVNRRVAITYESHSDGNKDKKKQMSTVLSTLTRLLYFRPKKC